MPVFATKGSRVLEKKVNETQVSKAVFGHLNHYSRKQGWYCVLFSKRRWRPSRLKLGDIMDTWVDNAFKTGHIANKTQFEKKILSRSPLMFFFFKLTCIAYRLCMYSLCMSLDICYMHLRTSRALLPYLCSLSMCWIIISVMCMCHWTR